MSLIDEIATLMLREGEIKAQEARERIAAEEETRQGKHRVRNTALKYIAQYAPLLIPGVGPFISAGVQAGYRIANNRGVGAPSDRLIEYR